MVVVVVRGGKGEVKVVVAVMVTAKVVAVMLVMVMMVVVIVVVVVVVVAIAVIAAVVHCYSRHIFRHHRHHNHQHSFILGVFSVAVVDTLQEEIKQTIEDKCYSIGTCVPQQAPVGDRATVCRYGQLLVDPLP